MNNMDGQVFLRTTKIGGGFEKRDVLAYVDELNTKICNLEDQLKEAKAAASAGSGEEIQKLNEEIRKLQQELSREKNISKQALRTIDEQKRS